MANYGEGFYGESGPTQLRNSPFRHNSPLVPPPTDKSGCLIDLFINRSSDTVNYVHTFNIIHIMEHNDNETLARILLANSLVSVAKFKNSVPFI